MSSQPAPKKPSSRREENKQATRAAIIAAAHAQFSAHGFADAALNDIVAAARVTTGAVYHHFGDKRGLFQAVAEDIERRILQHVGEATASLTDPWERLERGSLAMLDYCTQPGVARIVFVEAPTVIGPAEWRAIEMQFAYGQLRTLLVTMRETGEIKIASIDIAAQMLLGALIEAGNAIAMAQDEARAVADAKRIISLFIRNLGNSE